MPQEWSDHSDEKKRQLKCPICGYQINPYGWPTRIHIRLILIKDALEELAERFEDD